MEKYKGRSTKPNPARPHSRPACMYTASTAAESREALVPPAPPPTPGEVYIGRYKGGSMQKQIPRARSPLVCIPQAPPPPRVERRLHPLPPTHSGRNANGKIQAPKHTTTTKNARPPSRPACMHSTSAAIESTETLAPSASDFRGVAAHPPPHDQHTATPPAHDHMSANIFLFRTLPDLDNVLATTASLGMSSCATAAAFLGALA